jgi:site-specific DNA-methyltransferase (adenine-specific)
MRIIEGDCATEMSLLPAESIDLTVTSPPYDGLRTYNGYSFDFENIAKQLYRVTKIGGVVVWVVADGTKYGSESGTSFLQALFFKECRFNLHDTMIWVKDGGGAIGSNLCYTQNWEFMFVFSKGRPKVVNLLRDKPNKSAGKDKSGVGRRTVDGVHKIEKRKLCAEFSRRNNWWYIAPERGDHPAIFPESLAADHILSWSNPGDLVLDPFVGSGTTGKMAVLNNREFIGIDISNEYCELARKRIEGRK